MSRRSWRSSSVAPKKEERNEKEKWKMRGEYIMKRVRNGTYAFCHVAFVEEGEGVRKRERGGGRRESSRW